MAWKTPPMLNRPTNLRSWVGQVLTGEWMFWWGHPNGGTIVICRTIWVTVGIWATGLILNSIFKTCPSGCEFKVWGPLRNAEDALPWLGATFAGVYAALYARFAQQWNYLAGTYNQLYQTQAQIQNPNANEKIRYWKVAFAEDAADLHLATKPMFAPLVSGIIADPPRGLGGLFDQTAMGGTKRRKRLQVALDRAMGEEPPPVSRGVSAPYEPPQPASANSSASTSELVLSLACFASGCALGAVLARSSRR
jgi:hypothetical protein